MWLPNECRDRGFCFGFKSVIKAANGERLHTIFAPNDSMAQTVWYETDGNPLNKKRGNVGSRILGGDGERPLAGAERRTTVIFRSVFLGDGRRLFENAILVGRRWTLLFFFFLQQNKCVERTRFWCRTKKKIKNRIARFEIYL